MTMKKRTDPAVNQNQDSAEYRLEILSKSHARILAQKNELYEIVSKSTQFPNCPPEQAQAQIPQLRQYLAKIQLSPLDLLDLEIKTVEEGKKLKEALKEKMNIVSKNSETLKTRKKQEIESALWCSICMAVRKNAAFDPCGHMACRGCAEATLRITKVCPLCRAGVKTIKNVFL